MLWRVFSQFVTCCHQCAGMRLCGHYLQHQSSAWQRRVLKEQRGRGWRTYARSPSTGNFQIASPKSWWFHPSSCRWQFAFHRGSTPLKWHCICEKSAHESTKTKRINLRKTLTYSSARSPGTRKRTGLYLLNLYDFQWYICPKKAPFRVASLTDTHNKNIFVLFIFLAHKLKKIFYFSECPLSVDWQSPDCESQILMVLSQLPLAIFFPSVLHATE